VILSILPILKFKPDIIHCHDYHTAMIPFLLKFTNDHYFDNTKTILTIHNLQYQGRTTATCLQKLPFVVDFLSRDSDINFMEQGIIFADCITTVSPTYATEIMTKEFGAGLEKLLRKNKHKLMGILNGIDQDFFNPARDRLIVKNFSASNLATKKKNKEILQKISGLSVSTKPLVGLISRFVEQKGLDLITEEIIGLDCQFVFLGTGMVKYEDLFKAMAKKYPEKFSVHTKFDLKLAQLIYAGADIFLMPSRFEPCGLGQMIAMRYGTVPLARTVGGLADTVFDCQVDSVNCQSNGFSFKAMTVVALKKTLKRALEFYNDKEAWQKIQERGMTTDFSWQQSAQKYIALYQEVTAKN
jgi:starch synthase